MSKKYKFALQDYQRAFDRLDGSKDNGIEFLVAFGMVIVCDNLHLLEQRDENISRIRSMIDTFDDEEDLNDYRSMSDEDNRVHIYLRMLAGMAPSIEVRGILLSFLSEIFPSSLASYSLSKSNRPVKLAYFSYEKPVVARPCKSFWKRLEKLGHNIVRACDKVITLLERFCDVRDRLGGKPKPVQPDPPRREFI
ncbi:MAG: hypothetical protein K2X08_06700 [Chlamydiales bacterium]|nr:hypothetical protein [Chlamydiales bacterium]